ncbi:hypothetical protein [Mycolicibacterium brisbanense]
MERRGAYRLRPERPVPIDPATASGRAGAWVRDDRTESARRNSAAAPPATLLGQVRQAITADPKVE